MSTDEQHSTEPKIEVDNLVAANLQQYEEWPQIGKVLHVTRDSIEVQWYDGAYSEPWIPVKRKINGKYEYWTETIPLLSVILTNVKLTRSCRLEKSAIAQLKVYTRNSTTE